MRGLESSWKYGYMLNDIKLQNVVIIAVSETRLAGPRTHVRRTVQLLFSSVSAENEPKWYCVAISEKCRLNVRTTLLDPCVSFSSWMVMVVMGVFFDS